MILDGHPIRGAIRPTSVKGLDIASGSMALASADLVLSAVAGREVVLKDALTPIRGIMTTPWTVRLPWAF